MRPVRAPGVAVPGREHGLAASTSRAHTRAGAKILRRRESGPGAGDGASAKDAAVMDAKTRRLNSLCSEAVDIMIKDDDERLVEMRFELEKIIDGVHESTASDGDNFVELPLEFIKALNSLLSNELPSVSLLAGLQPGEHAAFLRVFHLIEDSGWSLEDVGGEREKDASADFQTLSAVSDHEVFQPPKNGRAKHL